MTRFDVVRRGPQLYVIVESELLPEDAAVVAIPLVEGYPGITLLNPRIEFDGTSYVLATRFIGPMERRHLRRVGDIAGQSDQVLRAIDVLISGF